MREESRLDRKRRAGSPASGESHQRHSSSKHRRHYDDGEERDDHRRGSRTQKYKREEGDGDEENGRRYHAGGDSKDIKPTSIHTPSPTAAAAKPRAEQRSMESIQEELRRKEVLYQVNMEIQQRMRTMNLPTQASHHSATAMKSASVLRPEEASAFIEVQMQKITRLAELKQRLGHRAGGSGGGGQSTALASAQQIAGSLNIAKTPALALEALRNATGGASGGRGMAQKALSSSLKSEGPSQSLYPTALQKALPSASVTADAEKIPEHVDPRLHAKSATRPHRRTTFAFTVEGEFSKLAHQQRSKAKLEKLQSEISKIAKQTGISSAVKLAIVTPSGADSVGATASDYIPQVEWWDEIVLGSGRSYAERPLEDENPLERYKESITALVEHPIQLKPPDEPLQPQYIKAHLTKREMRKLRRQNRREALKERMEKVRLGLERPAEPKLKISNLMRVLGNDAIQDPTRMEAVVRKQIVARMEKHVAENASRRLSKEQKSEKAVKKIAEDTSLAVHVAIYKVKSLANPAKRFKVHMNAKQLQLTGIILQLEDINVIVMEGGPKQQKFYKNLMMKRIKWSDEVAGAKKETPLTEGEEDGTGERNECVLIWEGIVQKRAFGEPRFVTATNQRHAREQLEKHGVPHYWDLCYSTTVLLSSDD